MSRETMRAAGAAGLAVLLLLGSGSMAADRNLPPFDLQGHRGARGVKPENTLPGFAEALAIGVSTLELDVGLTRDDVIVVSHDRRLRPDTTRGPDGRWLTAPGPPLRSLTLAQIKRFDVGRIRPGSRYARRFPRQEPVDGARIPTLSEVVALVEKARNDAVRFNIETKLTPAEPRLTADPVTFADRLVETLRRAGVAHRTAIQSFDWRTLQRVQAVAPEIPTVYLTGGAGWWHSAGARGSSAWTAGYDAAEHGGSLPRLVAAAGGAVWSPDYRRLDRASLEEAHALGLAVVVWTVNDPAAMAGLIELGVDGIITDYPGRLREVMAEAGIPLPEPTPVTP